MVDCRFRCDLVGMCQDRSPSVGLDPLGFPDGVLAWPPFVQLLQNCVFRMIAFADESL